MVFKAKQRAKNNYYGAKRDSIDRGTRVDPMKGQREKEFDYSYNWPHDFYSLVELAEIEAGVEMTTEVPTSLPSEPEVVTVADPAPEAPVTPATTPTLTRAASIAKDAPAPLAGRGQLIGKIKGRPRRK